jgi:hypothetical protein
VRGKAAGYSRLETMLFHGREERRDPHFFSFLWRVSFSLFGLQEEHGLLANTNQTPSTERRKMSRFIKCIAIPALAIAFMAVAGPSKAEAGGFGFGGVRIGVGHHIGHRTFHHPRIIRHHSPLYSGHFGHRSYYHDTTHLDYHRPTVIPHNGHFDYVPGHYDVHRTGHWHH